MNASIRRWIGHLILAAGAATLALTATHLGFAQGPQGRGPQDGFPDLAAGLRETEGCLGVQTAFTPSGQQAIFAWFEDKAAAKRWYWSEVHQGAVAAFFPDTVIEEGHEPMQDVPENIGPILAIASITFAAEGELDDVALPIKQIAIELYTPISGGLALGGRFAPSELVVPKRKIVVDEED